MVGESGGSGENEKWVDFMDVLGVEGTFRVGGS